MSRMGPHLQMDAICHLRQLTSIRGRLGVGARRWWIALLTMRLHGPPLALTPSGRPSVPAAPHARCPGPCSSISGEVVAQARRPVPSTPPHSRSNHSPPLCPARTPLECSPLPPGRRRVSRLKTRYPHPARHYHHVGNDRRSRCVRLVTASSALGPIRSAPSVPASRAFLLCSRPPVPVAVFVYVPPSSPSTLRRR